MRLLVRRKSVRPAGEQACSCREARPMAADGPTVPAPHRPSPATCAAARAAAKPIRTASIALGADAQPQLACTSCAATGSLSTPRIPTNGF